MSLRRTPSLTIYFHSSSSRGSFWLLQQYLPLRFCPYHFLQVMPSLTGLIVLFPMIDVSLTVLSQDLTLTSSIDLRIVQYRRSFTLLDILFEKSLYWKYTSVFWRNDLVNVQNHSVICRHHDPSQVFIFSASVLYLFSLHCLLALISSLEYTITLLFTTLTP